MQYDTIISYSFYIFLTLTVVTKILLLKLNIKNVEANIGEVPQQFLDQIDLASHQKAAHYTIIKNRFSCFSIIAHVIILLVWLQLGLNILSGFIEMLGLSPLHSGVALFLLFNFINLILGIPESLYSTFVIEEKFGFNKMTPKLFIQDLLKQSLLLLIIMTPILYILFYLLYQAGHLWWFYAWVAIILIQFVIIWAYPKFIAPLFNKFSKLEDDQLTDKINNLSKAIDIKFKDYYVMNASIRSSHGNAYFTGFGKNKRIVFFDTLISTLSPTEVIAVLAHELGHLKKKHILKSIIISSVTLLIGSFILGQLYQSSEFFQAFGVKNKEPYMALLIFMLILPYYTYFFTPISSALSRKNEFEADEFAATYTDANDLISALLKMYKDNSSTLTPHPMYSKFYFSHPPAAERVKFLESLIK